MTQAVSDFASRRSKYVAGLLIRVIVCVLFIVVFTITTSLVSEAARGHFYPAIILLIGLILVNYPFWLIGKLYAFPLNHFYAHWALDLLLATLVVHMLGGVELPCGFVPYMIMILTSAVFLSQRASYIIATASTVCYDGLVLVEGLGIVQRQSEIWDHEYTVAAQVVIVFASNVFFFLFSYLAGSLAEELKQANTALKAAQEELQQYNRTLENNVRRRTIALEDKNREIEEFVHIVTHDLRNVAVGASEVARRLLGSEEQNLSIRGRRYASNLVEDSRVMNKMLTHLLALFRVDHEIQRVEPVDVGALVGGIVVNSQRRLEEKGITVHVGAMPHCMLDPIQMSHVFANLLDNAIKYTGDKEYPEIRIECEEGESLVTFSVIDNGIGIPPEQMGRIFQMYHRGPDQSVQGVEQSGHGVGLTITKRIVERWGGQIWVESKEGWGARFSFTCPKDTISERRAI